MKYTISEEQGYVVIHFEGKIMGVDADKYRDKVKELIDEGKTKMIADLTNVSFVNSTGLGVLISTLITLRKEDGDIKLCGASDHIKTLFRVSKLFRMFDHYDTLEKAIASFK